MGEGFVKAGFYAQECAASLVPFAADSTHQLFTWLCDMKVSGI